MNPCREVGKAHGAAVGFCFCVEEEAEGDKLRQVR